MREDEWHKAMAKDTKTVADEVGLGMHEIDLTIKNHLENYVDLRAKNLDISTNGIEYEIENGFKAIAKEVKEGFDRLIEAQSKEDLLSKWHKGE